MRPPSTSCMFELSLCLCQGQGIQSDTGTEKKRQRLCLYTQLLLPECPVTLIVWVTSLPLGGDNESVEERQEAPAVWSKVGAWVVEESDLSYNIFHVNPLSYHLVELIRQQTFCSVMLLNWTIEVKLWGSFQIFLWEVVVMVVYFTYRGT